MGEKQEISSIIIQHDWLLEALNEEEYAVFEKCKGISRTILLRYRVNWRGREDRQGLGKQRPIRDPSIFMHRAKSYWLEDEFGFLMECAKVNCL